MPRGESAGSDVLNSGISGWLTLLRGLTARPVPGSKLVTSDAHSGLVTAVGATMESWQRCRTHYAANLMAITSKSAWGWVKMMLHSI